MAKLKNISDFCKPNVMFLIAIFIFAIVSIGIYSNSKSKNFEGNTGVAGSAQSVSNSPSSMPNTGINAAGPAGSNEDYATVTGLNSGNNGGLPATDTNTARQNINNPEELLPQDSSSNWAKLNPSGSGDVGDVNMLKAGHHVGINTVGNSLRNANQTLRSDPPIPVQNVGPFLNSTIGPDKWRVPFEIGVPPASCGSESTM
uniref:Minor capsid protein P11 C-terminal conserved region domain-containing protein n=1 Tax=viral metagenome TaxID=1070528 RepID=A0A6C0AX54_9ZZZZ|tara:strand:+ start:418 stop:1020 length:603 start_codon:yes stop_codon:yes gene_type:complete